MGNTWTVTTAADSTEERVLERTTYRGKSALRVDSKHSTPGGDMVTAYFIVPGASKNQQLGSISSLPAFYESYAEPAIDIYKDMAVGETRSQSFTTFNSTVSGHIANTISVTNRVTYAGRETITVPAGTFETCKEVAEIISAGRTVTVTHWLLASGKYAGLHAKLDATETTKLNVSW